VGQFGDKFRKAREKKGISLEDVSNVTKISARMLQAIEEEKFDQLPGGVFNKGFIRAYARHVGLNDEEAVNEYLACLRQAQIDAQAVWEPNAGKRPQVAAHQIAANQAVAGKVSRHVATTGTQSVSGVEELPELQLPRIEDMRRPRPTFANRRNPLPWRPVVIALLLLVAVGVLWQRRMRHARAEGAAVAAASMPQATQQVAVSPPETAASQSTSPNGVSVNRSLPAKTSAPSNRPSTTTVPKPQNATPATDDEESVSAEGTNGNEGTTPVPGAKTPTRFQLVIHADENSWISVTADGQAVSHETLIAPADTSIRANREIVARIGNAAGISFVWNGQEIQPQGAEAEVKTFVFDENGMHEAPTAPSPSPSH
jgi:cytoskeletal protein RodZ